MSLIGDQSLPVRDDAEAIIVVPCYNEEHRLNAAAFQAFAVVHDEIRFVFVNDGSSDNTQHVLQTIHEADPRHFGFVQLSRNCGKAEAVRTGLLAAFSMDVGCVGFWDADLATPLDEIPRFVAAMREVPERLMVLGSRVRLLGRRIERSPVRHYLGRVFATAASLTLRLPVYDTQCGAKLFRAEPVVREVFAEPFISRWIFDVEILARYLNALQDSSRITAERSIIEIPLTVWSDVGESKVKLVDFVASAFEMLAIHRRYRVR